MRTLSAAILVSLASASGAAAGADCPDWLRAAGSLSPRPGSEASAVVLFNEGRTTVGADGHATCVSRGAVRVLTQTGARYALAAADYDASSEQVRDFSAWLLRPTGTVKKYDRHDVVERTEEMENLYGQSRTATIDAESDADSGSTFGWEWTRRENGIWPERDWSFQWWHVPVLRSTYSVDVPPGWSLDASVVNHAPFEPAVTGTTRTWELSDLPAIPDEELAPPLARFGARLAVRWRPAGGAATAVPRFETWSDVARWLVQVSDPAAVPTPSIVNAARALVAGATTRFDSLRSIGRFVQRLRYEEISLNLGRGGGYRPRPASKVLEKGYGDCKDKATLTRSLLAAIGVPAELVLVNIGGTTDARADWPSPLFDHCILAVDMPPGSTLAAIVPGHDRDLLFFDPTDPVTLLGALSAREQTALALPVSDTTHALLRLPVEPPHYSRRTFHLAASLSPDGRLEGRLEERASGYEAAELRHTVASVADAPYRRSTEAWLSGAMPGVLVRSLETAVDSVAGGFRRSIDFEIARGFVQRLGNGMVLLRLPAFVREGLPSLRAPTRVLPVALRPHAYADTLIIALPDRFSVQELPAPVDLESDFARFSCRYAAEAGSLVCTRSFGVQRVELPAERCDDLRRFDERIAAALSAPVTLVVR